MSKADEEYQRVMRNVLEYGIKDVDRTGVGTISSFSEYMRFDMRDGFPLYTLRKFYFDTISSENLWFIEGSGDERRLAEIRFGKSRSELDDKATIWTANANSDYWLERNLAQFPGDCGRIYGVQFRHWRTWNDATGEYDVTDQLARVIQTLKTNPTDRRLIVTAWNPGELHQMALPPCHGPYQFYCRNGELSLNVTMRSNDLYLGNPANVAGYALILMMVAHVCNLEPRHLVFNLVDCHLYLNHIDQAREIVSRTGFNSPTVTLNPDITDIDRFTMQDITLHGYTSHPPLPGAMAV